MRWRIVFPDFRPLTDHLQVTQLTLHRVRVNLTHVPSSVGFLDVSDMKKPYPVIAVGDRDSMVLRDHVTVNGQYGLGVHPQPSDLKVKLNYKKKCSSAHPFVSLMQCFPNLF